jgi:hypothetical protein
MNAARAQVGEQPLHWDPIAAKVAQAWANQCNWGHDPNRSAEYAQDGGGNTGLGENIALYAGTTPPSESPADAVKQWTQEQMYYTHASNSCAAGQECGHYTQIVWSTTTGVGCAQAQCSANSPFGASAPYWTFTVCEYSPPGNWVGQSPY